jgi:hypothetical protein
VEPQETFDAAARFYEQGRYSEAINAYDQLLTNGIVTPAVLFNQGNAWLRTDQIGKAIACYAQAQRFQPRDPDITANLRLARGKVDPPTAPRGLRPWLQRFTSQEWAIAALTLTWLCGLVLIARELLPRIRPPTTSLAWLLGGLSVVVTAGAVAAGIEERRPFAVVISATPARFGPLEESQTAFPLPDGAEVMVTDRKDAWVQVRSSSGRSGWIPRAHVAFVSRPKAPPLDPVSHDP